jgi:DNA-binding transcriptional regulator LsrR (DeoR family)
MTPKLKPIKLEDIKTVQIHEFEKVDDDYEYYMPSGFQKDYHGRYALLNAMLNTRKETMQILYIDNQVDKPKIGIAMDALTALRYVYNDLKELTLQKIQVGSISSIDDAVCMIPEPDTKENLPNQQVACKILQDYLQKHGQNMNVI